MGEQTKITLREVPKQIPLNDISENPQNPRKYFDEIQELAENIKAVGLLQPRGLGKNLASSLRDAAKIYKRKEGNPNAYHCKRERIRGLPGWVTPRQNCRYYPIYA